MLFDVLDSSRVVDIDLPFISDNYTLLYFDEFPMLYTGTNEDGQRIFGSLMCEDEDKDIFRYLHLIVKNKDYLDFIKHRISYRELIEKQKSAFLIDKDELDNIVNTFCVPIKAIPIEFLPHKDLLCPNAELEKLYISNMTTSQNGINRQ